MRTATHPRWSSWLAVLPFAWLLFALIHSAQSNSVTVDEFQHLPAGVVYWQTGDFSFNAYNPPLLRLLAAAPLMADARVHAPDVALNDSRWNAGQVFQQSLGQAYHDVFVRARLMIMLITLLTAFLIYRLAQRGIGQGAALMALTLFSFNPLVLAHGALVTTDAGFSLAFLATCVAAVRLLQVATTGRALVLGVVLGLALLTKFTAVLLVPMLLAAAGLMSVLGNRPDLVAAYGWLRLPALRRSLQLLLVLVIATGVVNAGYLFDGSGQPLAAHTFTHPLLLKLSGSWIGQLPLPFPADFVRGFDLQYAQAAELFSGYFMGKVATTGWWYYYPAALLLKTPTLFWLMFVALFVAIATRRLPLTALLIATLIMPLVGLVAFSALTSINIGLRYLLFMMPFLCLALAHLTLAEGVRDHVRGLALAMVAYAASVAVYHPNYLGYFSELAGGPARGHRYLADSNLDWGQDLLRLRAYLHANGIATVALSNFGLVDPGVYGIVHKSVAEAAAGDTVVISINHLLGLDPWGQASGVEPYRDQSPKARIGTSLWVFDAVNR